MTASFQYVHLYISRHFHAASYDLGSTGMPSVLAPRGTSDRATETARLSVTTQPTTRTDELTGPRAKPHQSTRVPRIPPARAQQLRPPNGQLTKAPHRHPSSVSGSVPLPLRDHHPRHPHPYPYPPHSLLPFYFTPPSCPASRPSHSLPPCDPGHTLRAPITRPWPWPPASPAPRTAG